MASTTRPNVFKSKPSVGHSRQKMLFPRLHPRLGIEFVFVIIVIEPAIENRNDTVKGFVLFQFNFHSARFNPIQESFL